MRWRPARRDDCAALAAVSRRSVRGRAPLSEPELFDQLFDAARGHGAHTHVLTDEEDRPRAALGWVSAGEQLFLSPLIAEEQRDAAALLERGRAAALAAGAAWIRGSAGAGEAAQRALAAAGYQRRFDFVDLASSVAALRSGPAAAAAPPASFSAMPLLAADREALLELHNRSFAGVPSSPPLSREDLDELCASPRLVAAASHVLVDEHGAQAAFLLCLTGPSAEVAVVEAVGVASRFRRRGLAARAIHLAAAALPAAGFTELRALIASTNTASLQLHQALGFGEKHRRQVWQLSLR